MSGVAGAGPARLPLGPAPPPPGSELARPPRLLYNLSRNVTTYNVSAVELQEAPPEQRLRVPLRWALDDKGVRLGTTKSEASVEGEAAG